MPDLFDPLRGLGDDTPITPPSEVRRRGDRLRRRRRTLQVFGTAAVAVVATGTTLVLDGAGGRGTPGPPVATEPPGGWLREIPTQYALDRGWPDPDGVETMQLGPSQKWAPFTEETIVACNQTSYPSEHPVDSVGAVWDAPEDFRRRELTIYRTPAMATKVTDKLLEVWERCSTETLTDPPFEWTTTVAKASLGDASWTIVKGAPQFPSLQVFNVVRVGNAVLVTSTSNEGTLENASPDVDREATQARALSADMCIFALEPCGLPPDDGAEVSGKIPPLDKAALLTTEELTEELPGEWREIANREDPTLDCQADWLNQLKAEKGAFREWQAPGAEAATAVLEYADVPSAEAAYETVRWWVATCDDRLPGVRPLEPLTELGKDFDYSTGPTYVRRATSGADDGLRWVDDQAVSLAGRRIVLLSVATLTDGDVEPTPFHHVLDHASTRALAPQILGPKGYGDLELGMTAEEAEATGLVRVFPGEGCRGLQLTSSPVTKSAVDGYISDEYGLAALYGGITVERIAYGSTLDDLKARYPDVRKEPSGWYADVDGEPQSTYYFGVEDGKVVAVSLQLKEQDCVN